MHKNLGQNRIIPYRMLVNATAITNELIAKIVPKSGIPSMRIGLQKLEPVLNTYIKKAEEGLPVVGYHFSFPAEYLQCFDCVPVCVEGTSFFLAAFLEGGSEKYYDLMHNYGHPFHTCTSQKGTMGMTLDDLFKFDAIITPSAPCDCTIASYPFFKYARNIPLVLLDLPFSREEKSIEYYADQLKGGIRKLGKVIGQEPDFNKLKKAIEIENQVNKVKLEIFELIKATPSPISNFYNAISAALPIFISGTPEILSFYEEMLNIVKKRYKAKEHYGGEEKVRSIWPYMITFFSIDLMEWLDRELGLSVLFDIFNYNFYDSIDTKSDLDTLFNGMSRKSLGFPMVKQSTEFYDPFIEDCIKFAKTFSADCFIYTQSIACKQFGSAPQILREALRDEVGIPMLLIEFDAGDARMTSLKAFKEKISMFTQTVS